MNASLAFTAHFSINFRSNAVMIVARVSGTLDVSGTLHYNRRAASGQEWLRRRARRKRGEQRLSSEEP